MHKPAWFKPGLVAVSNAPTCGINKDGEDLFIIEASSGRRTEVLDDVLSRDAKALMNGSGSETLSWVDLEDVSKKAIAVPNYYDSRPIDAFRAELETKRPTFTEATIGDLMKAGRLEVHGGHGSPSADLRSGDIPYIKVSDLRAGQININPTNRVTQVVAEQFWKGTSSGLRAFDLISPARTSKNIGDFAVLMPGQEEVVLTKEVLVMRPGPEADFDAFYLLWAMSLRSVRAQWQRIIFMQTNREDTGSRFKEILIPVPSGPAEAEMVSAPFRTYYQQVAALRNEFRHYLASDPDHHVYLGDHDTESLPPEE